MPDPELSYAGQNGLWHLVEREEYPEVLTVCGQRLVATAHPFRTEPVPLCWQCREARRRLA